MIDIKKIVLNKDLYIKKFKEKGYDLNKEVCKAVELYSKYDVALKNEQNVRFELNNISVEIKTNPTNELKQKAQSISENAKKWTSQVNRLKGDLNETILHFPNIARDDVKVGENENDNTVISSHLDEFKKENKKPHWEWLEDKKHIMIEESGMISGSRHVIYKGKVAELVNAIEMFMVDEHIKNGIELIKPPVIVNEKALINTGQLPKFKEDLYELDNGQFLIPTAEVPLTNLVANKILKEEQLPIKYTALTNCFRQEAGAAGKDTRGLIRLHQFRKVELVTIGKPSEEKQDLNAMLLSSTSLLDKLEIPYRIVQLCTGDTSFASSITYDIEVWMPGVNQYREISSVSSAGNFQARRMKTRYQDSKGKKTFVNTYNGSALAISRTLAAIVENYLDNNGILQIPTVLKPYLSFKSI